MRMRVIGLCVFAAALWIARTAPAQEDGCCQYTVRTGNQTQRRCADLSKAECAALKPVSTFLRGLECDTRTQQCARTVPTLTPTPIPTRTITPTRTPTARPQSQVRGCCQLNSAPRPGSICGNDIVAASCEATNTVFCESCTCSSHDEDGFTRAQGVCLAFTPAPTRTPTPTPVRTPIGCCELENLRHISNPVCGNAIAQASCFSDYAGSPSFCLDCVCSSHDDGGFTLDAGACVTKTPTRTPTRTPVPKMGCCQLDAFSGGHTAVCGNQVSEAACLSDSRGTPSFCAACVCSSHTGAGFTAARGGCVDRRRPARPVRPHIPRPPRSPR